MEDINDEILDEYVNAKGIAECSFWIMGKLLDAVYLKKRIDLLNVDRLYIYGGGYLGIQTYRTCSDLIDIPAIVDKSGKLSLDISDIPVIDFEGFRKVYKGEKVIIASVKFYQEIYNELSGFIPVTRLLFLGEFLGGILS